MKAGAKTCECYSPSQGIHSLSFNTPAPVDEQIDMAMTKFPIPKEALVPSMTLKTRYGDMAVGLSPTDDLKQWAQNNVCKITLEHDLTWYIYIPENSNAALEYKLAWM